MRARRAQSWNCHVQSVHQDTVKRFGIRATLNCQLQREFAQVSGARYHIERDSEWVKLLMQVRVYRDASHRFSTTWNEFGSISPIIYRQDYRFHQLIQVFSIACTDCLIGLVLYHKIIYRPRWIKLHRASRFHSSAQVFIDYRYLPC